VVRSYRELEAWQQAIGFAQMIYEFTQDFPQNERFGLTNQLRRSAVSVASNIAEGQGRASTKEFLHFLHIAAASLQECETQYVIARNLGFLSEGDFTKLEDLAATVGRLISGLIRALRRKSD
jgi:four helix bundle protein